MRRFQPLRVPVVVALLLLPAGPGRAQSSAAAPEAPAGVVADTLRGGDLPVSLDRIRAALERAPQSRLKLPAQPTFSITIEARSLRIEDLLDLEELARNPTVPTSATHREFLAMVTPPEARQFGAFDADELAVVAATSLATGLALGTLPSLIKDALRRRQEAQAKREVAEVLAELERQRTQPAQDK